MTIDYHPDGANPAAYENSLFEAVLLPYRSLSPFGFQVLVFSLLLAWVCFGIVFMRIGAWPVFGFFGLDVALIFLAFRLNYRAAQKREEISVSRSQLLIRQISASGKINSYTFNPFRTRFQVTRKPDIGITHMQITAEGKALVIGSFLPPDDRESFAAAFASALTRSRR